MHYSFFLPSPPPSSTTPHSNGVDAALLRTGQVRLNFPMPLDLVHDLPMTPSCFASHPLLRRIPRLLRVIVHCHWPEPPVQASELISSGPSWLRWLPLVPPLCLEPFASDRRRFARRTVGWAFPFFFFPFCPISCTPALSTVSTPKPSRALLPNPTLYDSLPIKASVLDTFLSLNLHDGRGALSAEPRGDRMTAVLLGQLLSLPSRTCPLYTPPHVPPTLLLCHRARLEFS